MPLLKTEGLRAGRGAGPTQRPRAGVVSQAWGERGRRGKGRWGQGVAGVPRRRTPGTSVGGRRWGRHSWHPRPGRRPEAPALRPRPRPAPALVRPQRRRGAGGLARSAVGRRARCRPSGLRARGARADAAGGSSLLASREPAALDTHLPDAGGRPTEKAALRRSWRPQDPGSLAGGRGTESGGETPAGTTFVGHVTALPSFRRRLRMELRTLSTALS